MIKLENSPVPLKDDAQDVLKPSKPTNESLKSGHPYLL
jgi:hypothetical protein